MPTIRRRATPRRQTPRGELDGWERLALEFGPVLLLDRDQIAALWEAHGRAYLAEFIARRPGERPWAWWQWQASEPRRVVNPPDIEPHYLERADRRRPGDVWCLGPRGWAPWLETEADYLDRHNLWRAGERARWLALGEAEAPAPPDCPGIALDPIPTLVDAPAEP